MGSIARAPAVFLQPAHRGSAHKTNRRTRRWQMLAVQLLQLFRLFWFPGRRWLLPGGRGLLSGGRWSLLGGRWLLAFAHISRTN